ncbi:MAG: S8 family serine peptidase [Candidatus Thorarchaeota archaeon]
MHYYWDPEQPTRNEQKTDTKKLIGAVIIILIVLPVTIVLLSGILPDIPSEGQNIRVAVLDTGIDQTLDLQGRIGPQKSFVSTQYGYDSTDSTVGDAKPSDVAHGTLVAGMIAENSRNAEIINAKVIGSSGSATVLGIIAAIEWSLKQNCTVINLSLGSTPAYGDPLEEAVEKAFRQGAIVIGAAGNEGQDGIAGTSISSPSVFPYCIAVGALDENDIPDDYTSLGPTYSRNMKPDILAAGFVQSGQSKYYGTSFAAPRVAAAVSELIAYCCESDIKYTPGSITTALLAGADSMDYPSYIVGAGKLNLDESINLISEQSNNGGIPEISFTHPSTLPLNFEKLFFGDNYTFNIQLFNGEKTTYDVTEISNSPDVFEIDPQVTINQTGLIPISICVPESGDTTYSAEIMFNSTEFGSSTLILSFSAGEPLARVAFDISHSAWDIDTYYGQFKELYIELTSNGFSVQEIRNPSNLNEDYLGLFDGVLVLDPCVWDVNRTIPADPQPFSLQFTDGEIEAYENYVNSGGGIFVASLSNSSTDVKSVNEFLNWTGFSLSFSAIEHSEETALVTRIENHPITTDVTSFDYEGARINTPTEDNILASYRRSTVLGVREMGSNGRLVVTGSNFFIDNWALAGQYQSSDNGLLALGIVSWITHQT